MKRSIYGALVTALLLMMMPGAASAEKAKSADEPDYFVVEESLPFAAIPGFENSERSWGIHNGAGYQIEVPAEWNGDLIMWAHGFRGEGPALFFNENEFPPAVRAWMLDQGYAWAQSTYSKNGYNVAQGVKDTHALSKFFNGVAGNPDNVYITGYSMGGHITAVSAEQHSSSYTGAMPMCGVVGDYELFDYFLDFNVAAQQIALGESRFPVGVDYLTSTVPEIKSGLGPFFPFALNQSGVAFSQLVELRSGGERAGFEDAFRFWNSTVPDPNGNFLFGFGVGNGALPGRPGVAVDNIGVEYQVDLDPGLSDFEQELNAGIARVQADRSARSSRGLSNVPRIDGIIEIPTLTMHNIGDLFVPFHNEVVYAGEAEASGTRDLLVQRAILGASHCDFAAAEVIAGLGALIAWSDGGPKPGGQDFLDPTVVSDPDLGCPYSEGLHFVGLNQMGSPQFRDC